MNLLQQAKDRLERSKAALGETNAAEAERVIDTLEKLLDNAKQKTAQIQKNEHLNATGKKSEREAIQAELRKQLEAGVSKLEAMVAARETEHRAKLKLAPIQGEDAQGRLANAREEALLVLDRTPDDRLAQAMETLARDSGDIGVLMLDGFAERYLQARASNESAARWTAKKQSLLVERLGESAQEAAAALERLSDARAAAIMAKHHVHHAVNDLDTSKSAS